MSDGATVILAIAVWLGALAAAPVPRWCAVVVTVLAFALRRPTVLLPAGLLLASSLSASAYAGLHPPTSVRVHREAVLVSDPVEVGHALHVELRLGGRRVEAWARGEPASALHDRLAGEVVVVEGSLQGAAADARARLSVRHIGSRLSIERVGPWRAGSPATRAANGLRRLLSTGAKSLPLDRRSLLSGFLLGDDRELPPTIEADFRAAGLTHLLAVSGQNLAFTFAAFGPLLRRLGLRGRLVVSLAVIGFFALITRAEPSVLRASAMAVLACWSAYAGRPVSRLRILCLAVAALLLVDPMLARSVGFQLSVGASLGLALLAKPIAERLPGPRWLAESLGVTIAAQLGVAPILTTTFGGLPLITIVANLLAVPVAGPLTAWGLTAGIVAGVLGGAPAALVHLPTGAMVWWIEAVARSSARVPLGLIGARDLAMAVAVALGFGWLGWRRVAFAAAAAVLVLAAWPTEGALSADAVARGARVWRAGATALVLDGGVDSAMLLAGLGRAGIRRIDLVVARRGSADMGGVIADLRARLPVGSVAAPPGNLIRDATTIETERIVTVGRLSVRLAPHGTTLDADLS